MDQLQKKLAANDCEVSESTSASDHIPEEDENVPRTRANKVPMSKMKMLPVLNKVTQVAPQQKPSEISQAMLSPKGYSLEGTQKINPERQIKYLGLVIEKNEEQIIYEWDELNQIGKEIIPHDPVVRKYVPIRQEYITIVRNMRLLAFGGMEKRGHKDFKRTARALERQLHHLKN